MSGINGRDLSFGEVLIYLRMHLRPDVVGS